MSDVKKSLLFRIIACVCAVLAAASAAAAVVLLVQTAEVKKVRQELFTLEELGLAETLDSIDETEVEYYGEKLSLGEDATAVVREAVKRLGSTTLIKAKIKFFGSELLTFNANGKAVFSVFRARNELTREDGTIIASLSEESHDNDSIYRFESYQLVNPSDAEELIEYLRAEWLAAQPKYTLADFGYDKIANATMRVEISDGNDAGVVPLTDDAISELKSKLNDFVFIREEGRNIDKRRIKFCSEYGDFEMFCGRKSGSNQYRTYVADADGTVYRECSQSDPTGLWDDLYDVWKNSGK